MKVALRPWDALAIAVRMKRVVRADGERAMQVAMVKGLKRKLEGGQTESRAGAEGDGLPGSDGGTAPTQVFAGGGEETCGGCMPALCHLGQGIGTQQIHGREKQVGREGEAGRTGQEGEEGQ